MKNALILHGTNSSPDDNWFPWLKKELENKGWKVWVPNLPQSDQPNIKHYNKFILEGKGWKFDKESVIVGHSSGAVATLGLLQDLPENLVINKTVLVSSFKNNLGWDNLDGLFEKSFDFEKIKKQAKQFIFIHSDNDPYCPLEHAKYLADKVDGKLIIKRGQGHFNLEKNKKYKKFPFLLEVIVND